MTRIQVIGLDKVLKDFQRLKKSGRIIQREFMDLISTSTLNLLRQNTPVDTGELQAGWAILTRGHNFVDIGFRDGVLADRLFFVTRGTIFQAPNPFLQNVINSMLDTVMDTLQGSLRRHHPYFRHINLSAKRGGGVLGRGSSKISPTGQAGNVRGIRGKGRKFQQVGRTKASLTGHRQVGGAQVKRVGRGAKRLGRRLSLRRRRGRDARTLVKALMG